MGDLQSGNVPVRVGDDGVVHQAVGGVCLDVLDPPVGTCATQFCGSVCDSICSQSIADKRTGFTLAQ
jgi:hypothetical protein